jgi:DNA-binding MarR family transcriptional regulator
MPDQTDPGGEDEVVLPALLRAARGVYQRAIRARLTEAGFDDMPRNGPYVLGGMANHGGTPGQMVRDLQVSKQAASELIDALVVRGYLLRGEDPQDRRRMTLALTERGRAAAERVQAGVVAVDQELEQGIGPDGVAALRAGLLALAEIRQGMERDGRPS